MVGIEKQYLDGGIAQQPPWRPAIHVPWVLEYDWDIHARLLMKGTWNSKWKEIREVLFPDQLQVATDRSRHPESDNPWGLG